MACKNSKIDFRRREVLLPWTSYIMQRTPHMKTEKFSGIKPWLKICFFYTMKHIELNIPDFRDQMNLEVSLEQILRAIVILTSPNSSDGKVQLASSRLKGQLTCCGFKQRDLSASRTRKHYLRRDEEFAKAEVSTLNIMIIRCITNFTSSKVQKRQNLY